MNCCVVKYADDVTLCVPLFKNSDNSHVKSAHESLYNWATENGLNLNLSKCKSLLMSSSKDCEPVQLHNVSCVSSLRILGVTFNKKCTWSDHIDYVLRVSSRRMYPLRVLKNNFDVNKALLCQVYFSTIRSILEYCAPLFAGMSESDSSRIVRLQKRFHKLLCGPLCTKNCLPSLTSRRESQVLSFFQKMKNSDHILNFLFPRTSNHGRVILPFCRTSRRARSFLHKASLLFNQNHRR